MPGGTERKARGPDRVQAVWSAMKPVWSASAAILATSMLMLSCSSLGLQGDDVVPVLDPPGGFVPEPDRGPEQTWPEMFEFEVQPGDLNGVELDARIVRFNPAGGEPVPGSERHVGWVETPGGRVDFFAAQIRGSSHMPGTMWCSISTGAGGSRRVRTAIYRPRPSRRSPSVASNDPNPGAAGRPSSRSMAQ